MGQKFRKLLKEKRKRKKKKRKKTQPRQYYLSKGPPDGNFDLR